MNFFKKHKSKLIALISVIVILTAAYLSGGTTKDAADTLQAAEKKADTLVAADTVKEEKKPSAEETTQIVQHVQADTEEKPENTNEEPQAPLPPKTEAIKNDELTCTLSVSCHTAAGKSSEKASVIPADGIIYPEQTVVFFEGESVFDILLREMQKNNIHLEFTTAPLYNSAYIEGINNLYEFDMGELSGWMYRVNGEFPNFGCSAYTVSQGDKIEWLYTLDLGKDIGGETSGRNGIDTK